MSDAAHSDDSGALARRWGRVVGPLLFAAILLWPNLGLDALQRRAAAVTALVATLWLTQAIPLGAASLIPVALLPLLGVLNAREAAAVYMDDLVLLFLGAFIVALGLERWGVHKRMALFLVAHIGTRPRRLVLGFVAATAFVSMWINNTAATLMMFPIGLAVIATVSGEDVALRKRTTPFATALLIGIAYGASIGGMATPVGTAPNQVFLGQMHTLFPQSPQIGFAKWIIGWLPIVVVFVVGAWLILTRIALRVEDGDTLAADAIAEQRAKLGPMGRGEKMMAVVFGVTALLWVTREDMNLDQMTIPGWAGAFAHLQAFGVAGKTAAEFTRYATDATVAVAMAVLCFALPVDRKRGVYLLDWETAAKMPWDVLLLFGGGFCLAKGFQASGLDRWFGAVLAPALADRPAWQVVGIVVTVMTIATEFTSNVAITTLTLPVLAQTAVAGHFDPLLLMAPATIAASSGFALPVATPPNTIVFGSRLVPMGSMMRAGLALDALGIVLITFGFHFWVRHIWPIASSLPDWALAH